MKAKHKVEDNEGELALGMVIADGYLFSKCFQKADLSMEMTIPQKTMMCDNSKRILLCTSRNVGKTVGLIGRVMRTIVTYQPKSEDSHEEVLIFTPAEGHLTPLIDRLYANINANPFFRSLITTWNKGDKPKLVTKTGLTIHGRIEGSSGTDTNMVGLHPILIFGDECEYGNQICHRSRLGGAMPETKWLYSGVPNGVRGTPFFLLDQTKEGRSWSRHKFSMLTANPRFLLSKKYRKEMTEAFGGKTSPDYITQVKGEWGDEAVSSFPPGSIAWNTELPVYIARVVNSEIEPAIKGGTLPSVLRIPQCQCIKSCIGWDWGFAPDPSTFVLGVKMTDNGPWQTYARISLYQVGLPNQLAVLKYLVISVLRNTMMMLSIDSPECYQMLLSPDNKYLFENHIKMTNQGGTVEIDQITGKLITEQMLSDPEVQQHRKDGKVIKARRKYFLTEMFRRYMANSLLKSESDVRLEMFYDSELESELVSTIERKTEAGYTVYEVPRSKGVGKVAMDQIVDACRALVDCIVEVEHYGEPEQVNYDEVIAAMGWSGSVNPDRKWRGAWDSPAQF